MSQNYFHLFDLQPAPAIADHTVVVKKYQQLQKQFHPDFFTQATEEEKEEALQQSAIVNEAYKVLKDKYALIAYYLKINGQLEEDEKYSLPADFLMEMMELNEDLDEDAAVEGKVLQSIEQLEEEVTPVLRMESTSHSETDYQTLKEFYFKAKYLQRLLDRL